MAGLIKAGLVIVKIMLRPIISTLKNYIGNSYHPYVEGFFFNLGSNMHKFNYKIDTFLINAKSHGVNIKYKPFERSKYVEYGATVFFEYICLYGTVIIISFYELGKSIKASKRSSDVMKNLKQKIANMEYLNHQLKMEFDKNIKEIKDHNSRMEFDLQRIKEDLEKYKEETNKVLETINPEKTNHIQITNVQT